jgi:hypothetical protein
MIEGSTSAEQLFYGELLDQESTETLLPILARNLRLLENEEGAVVGRACIAPIESYLSAYPGVITVGGLRANELYNVCGILAGDPVRAARDMAIPIVDPEKLSIWATEQAALLSQSGLAPNIGVVAAAVVRTLGGHTENLPVAQTSSGWVTFADISERKQLPDGKPLPQEVIVVQKAEIANMKFEKFELHPNVLSTEMTTSLTTELYTVGAEWPAPETTGENRTLASWILEALAIAWNADTQILQEQVDRQHNTPFPAREVREIGVGDGKVMTSTSAYTIRNPNSSS